jgi:hypothetical protein
MKKYILFLIILSVGCIKIVSGQWSASGNDIFSTNSGNVCIGTGTYFAPDYKLHIKNGNNTAGIMCESAYSGTDNHSVGNFRFKNSTTGDLFNITLRKNGNVDEMLQSCYVSGDSHPWREFIYFNYGTKKYEMRNGIVDAEFKNTGNLMFNNGGTVSIGTSSPQSAAALEVTSVSKGFLPPRMSSAEMNSIQDPVDGLMVYCTDCSSDGMGLIALYMAGSWHTLSLNNCISPSTATSEGTNVPSEEQIIWNWNTVADATGYKWNSTNNYSTAEDMGSSTSKTEYSLNCNTSYTRYVWTYNSCGHSSATALSATTSSGNCFMCGATLVINHVAGNVAPVDKSTSYATVSGITGAETKCWITSNLGSDYQATAVNDASEPSAGWYWQFNHKQGFKHDGTTRTPNTTWINNLSESSNWIEANDPCTNELGPGWRLPTAVEYTFIDAAGNWANWDGPWNSALKMHAAGRLDYYYGTLDTRGTKGYYWSGTSSGYAELAQDLNFTFNASSEGIHSKSFGFPVRCLKD